MEELNLPPLLSAAADYVISAMHDVDTASSVRQGAPDPIAHWGGSTCAEMMCSSDPWCLLISETRTFRGMAGKQSIRVGGRGACDVLVCDDRISELHFTIEARFESRASVTSVAAHPNGSPVDVSTGLEPCAVDSGRNSALSQGRKRKSWKHHHDVSATSHISSPNQPSSTGGGLAMAEAVQFESNEEPQRCRLTQPVTQPDNQVVETNQTLLRPMLTDHSTNGTYVNGHRVRKRIPYPLKSGDRISMVKIGDKRHREGEQSGGVPAYVDHGDDGTFVESFYFHLYGEKEATPSDEHVMVGGPSTQMASLAVLPARGPGMSEVVATGSILPDPPYNELSSQFILPVYYADGRHNSPTGRGDGELAKYAVLPPMEVQWGAKIGAGASGEVYMGISVEGGFMIAIKVLKDTASPSHQSTQPSQPLDERNPASQSRDDTILTLSDVSLTIHSPSPGYLDDRTAEGENEETELNPSTNDVGRPCLEDTIAPIPPTSASDNFMSSDCPLAPLPAVDGPPKSKPLEMLVVARGDGSRYIVPIPPTISREHMRELYVLTQLNHRRVVKCLGFQHVPAKGLCIFMEYVAGGTLQSIIKSFGAFQENVIRIYTMQILEGLEYLEQQRVVHGDLKSANVLVSEVGSIKLADFGTSHIRSKAHGSSRPSRSTTANSLSSEGLGDQFVQGEEMHLVGTPLYMSPEFIQTEVSTAASDIWALGCIVYEMATGGILPWREIHHRDPISIIFFIGQQKRGPSMDELLAARSSSYKAASASNRSSGGDSASTATHSAPGSKSGSERNTPLSCTTAPTKCGWESGESMGLSLEFRHFVEATFTMEPNLRPTAKQLLQHPFIVGVRDSLALQIWERRQERSSSGSLLPANVFPSTPLPIKRIPSVQTRSGGIEGGQAHPSPMLLGAVEASTPPGISTMLPPPANGGSQTTSQFPSDSRATLVTPIKSPVPLRRSSPVTLEGISPLHPKAMRGQRTSTRDRGHRSPGSLGGDEAFHFSQRGGGNSPHSRRRSELSNHTSYVKEQERTRQQSWFPTTPPEARRGTSAMVGGYLGTCAYSVLGHGRPPPPPYSAAPLPLTNSQQPVLLANPSSQRMASSTTTQHFDPGVLQAYSQSVARTTSMEEWVARDSAVPTQANLPSAGVSSIGGAMRFVATATPAAPPHSVMGYGGSLAPHRPMEGQPGHELTGKGAKVSKSITPLNKKDRTVWPPSAVRGNSVLGGVASPADATRVVPNGSGGKPVEVRVVHPPTGLTHDFTGCSVSTRRGNSPSQPLSSAIGNGGGTSHPSHPFPGPRGRSPGRSRNRSLTPAVDLPLWTESSHDDATSTAAQRRRTESVPFTAHPERRSGVLGEATEAILLESGGRSVGVAEQPSSGVSSQQPSTEQPPPPIRTDRRQSAQQSRRATRSKKEATRQSRRRRVG